MITILNGYKGVEMGIRERPYFIVQCDYCPMIFENDAGGEQCFSNKPDAVVTIEGCDWTFRNGKWRCPACIEQP